MLYTNIDMTFTIQGSITDCELSMMGNKITVYLDEYPIKNMNVQRNENALCKTLNTNMILHFTVKKEIYEEEIKTLAKKICYCLSMYGITNINIHGSQIFATENNKQCNDIKNKNESSCFDKFINFLCCVSVSNSETVEPTKNNDEDMVDLR